MTRNATLGGCLSGNYYLDLYTIAGTSGTTLTIDATTTTANLILATVQSGTDGSILAQNYGGSAHVVYTFPTTTTYFIGVGFIGQFLTGPYTLRLTCGSSQSSCHYSGTLSLNSTTNGVLTSSDTACSGDATKFYMVVYSFAVSRGDAFAITLDAGFPVYIEIDRPDGSGMGRWSTNNSAVLSYEAEATESLYVYFASNTTTPVTGSFTVHVDSLTNPCRRRATTH